MINWMSCSDSSARWKSVTDATPYSQSKSETSNVADPDQGSRIRDPVPFWPLDPLSGIQDRDPGWVKSQDPDPGSGSGMKAWIIFPRAWKPFFWVKILKFFDAYPGSWIRDQGSGMEKIWIRNPGSGIEKIWIRDLGSGINILDQQHWKSRCQNLLGLKEPNNNQTLWGKGILGWDQVIFTI